MGWGNHTSERAPVFIPKAALSVAPITLAAGKVLVIDSTGFTNDGTPIADTPKLQDFMAIEWTIGSEALAQAYLNADTAKLGPPVSQALDGIDGKLTAYNIKNTGASSITVFVRGM